MKDEEMCCGACSMFEHEDTDGYGVCAFHLMERRCSDVCEDYELINGEEE